MLGCILGIKIRLLDLQELHRPPTYIFVCLSPLDSFSCCARIL